MSMSRHADTSGEASHGNWLCYANKPVSKGFSKGLNNANH